MDEIIKSVSSVIDDVSDGAPAALAGVVVGSWTALMLGILLWTHKSERWQWVVLLVLVVVWFACGKLEGPDLGP
jgi:hypothetical protein